MIDQQRKFAALQHFFNSTFSKGIYSFIPVLSRTTEY